MTTSGNLARMKLAVQQKQLAARMQAAEQQTAAPQQQPAPLPAPKPKAEKPPTPPADRVKHKCGHQLPVAAIANTDCPGCAAKRRKAFNLKRQEQRQAWLERHGRLPHGAEFHVRYDADSQTWSGTLAIPGNPGGMPLVFEGSASGVHRLLSELNAEWVEFKERPRPAA